MNAARRMPPLAPESQNPVCAMCGGVTELIDRFHCFTCHASWSVSNYWNVDGEWDDPSLTQCPATVRPYGDDASLYLSKVVYRCLLSEAHGDQHRGTCERGDDIHDWGHVDLDGYLTRDFRAADRLALAESVAIPPEPHTPGGGPGAVART